MRLRWLINVLLLLGVVALALFAIRKNNTPSDPGFKLSTLTPSAVSKIVVETRAGSGYTLEKREGEWQLTAPYGARADQSQVQRLLDITAATSKERLAATDLARFDLAAPVLKVTVDSQTFSFGTVNPLTQEQYVATGDAVYLVTTFYASLAPPKAERLLAHRVLREPEVPVGFAFPGFTVEQHDGKWVLAPAPADEKERPSQDDLNRWSDEWRYASSLVTMPWDGKAGNESISVKLANGKSVELRIVRKTPELVLARPDEKLQFQFSTEMSKRLLRPTAAKEPSAGAS